MAESEPGQASALVRGIEADCGCFGAGEPVSFLSLLRTVALLGGAVLCAWRGANSAHLRRSSAAAQQDAQSIAPAT